MSLDHTLKGREFSGRRTSGCQTAGQARASKRKKLRKVLGWLKNPGLEDEPRAFLEKERYRLEALLS
jgi:hypothetical protein